MRFARALLLALKDACFSAHRRFEMSRGEVCQGSGTSSARPLTDLSLARFVRASYFRRAKKRSRRSAYNRNLKQLGRQRQGRRRFQNEYIHIFSWNFANDWMCLPSLIVPQVNLSITYESGVEFQWKLGMELGTMETQILMISLVILQKTAKKCAQC